MHSQARLFTPRRVSLLVVISLFLASIYMLTYSARVDTTDALFLLDSVGSVVRFGDLLLDVSAGMRPPLPQMLNTSAPYTLPEMGAEPFQVFVAAALYWLADHLPGVGLIHAVYLLNVIVGGLVGGVLFLYALALGYNERTAVAAALVFGLGSMLWPYTRSFFQEPLTLLLLLITALLVERWRAGGYRALWLIGCAGVVLAAAILTKGAATLALPGLVLIALPPLRFAQRENRYHWGRVLLVSVGGIALLLALGDLLDITDRAGQFMDALGRQQPYAGVALHTYLLSIGGSFWATSPVLLLAVSGIWWLHRQRHYRYVLVAGAMILSFALVYALRQGPGWFGGLSWPPRFLLPAIPFVFLCTLPVIDRVMNGRAALWLRAVFVVVCLYSLWVQFTGVSLWWGEYANALPPESGNISEWTGGLNEVRYLRWVYIPSLWADRPLDFAWIRLDVPGWVLAFGGLALVSAYVLWRLLRERRIQALVIVALPLIFAGMVWGGLRAIYDDPLYLGFDDDLHALLPVLEAETRPGDVVILSDVSYHRFFMNYGKLDAPRLVSLPDHPGEQPSPEQPPEVESINPQALLDWKAPPLIHGLAETRQRIWLLTNNGPFIPWSVRAVERFMSEQYFPSREFVISPRVRLIEYATRPLRGPYSFQNPEYSADLVYGDVIHLGGYDLPAGTLFTPGDVVPVALYWWADAPPQERYKVALLLRDSQGVAVGDAWNTEPGGGFSPTDSWVTGVPVWDQRGVYLPDDIAPGEYQFWLVLYSQDEAGAVENLPVTGAETHEGFIGVLPTRISVTGE